jgi:hypothetical protein
MIISDGRFAMSILVQRYFRRSRAVEELAEDWQIEHKNAMLVRDVEELVCECLELGKLAKYVWNASSDSLFDGMIKDLDVIGGMLRMAIGRTKYTFCLVNEGIGEAQRQGYEIARAAEFCTTVQEVNSMAVDFEKTWPAANKGMAREALAAYHRGEFMDSGDLLANAQGKST